MSTLIYMYVADGEDTEEVYVRLSLYNIVSYFY